MAAGAQKPECTRPVHEDIEHRRTPSGARAVDFRSISGFTLLELVIVIILVIVLFLTAYNRLMPLRGDAEATHVMTVIGSLRSALGLAATERVMEGGLEALETMAGTNPMALLQKTPDNYLGEADGPVPAGHWYFDRASGQLRYRVRYPQYLAGAPAGPVELAWRVRVLGQGEPDGIYLTALYNNARWPGHSRALREISADPTAAVVPRP